MAGDNFFSPVEMQQFKWILLMFTQHTGLTFFNFSILVTGLEKQYAVYAAKGPVWGEFMSIYIMPDWKYSVGILHEYIKHRCSCIYLISHCAFIAK